jgi:2-polyprenyl-6-methoxyphenol hydroxylase-like FAD-dependent oxidoreductase
MLPVVLLVSRAVQCGRDVGDRLLLEEAYEAPRRRANGAMSTALDGLQRIFLPPAGPLAAARNLGLALVNASPTAKQTLMRYAMFGT